MKKTEPKYRVSIDVMRAIAILLMVQVHFVENLSPREPSSAGYYDLSAALGMLPAPIFSFLVGLNLWLWILRETKLGRKRAEIRKIIARRGILLFGAGLAFATLIWLPESVFIWDILTFLGASTVIVFALRKLPLWIIAGLIVLALCVSPLLRLETGYASHWRGSEYVYEFKMRDVVLGFLLHGYFPLLPWVIFPLLGWVVGRRYFDDPKKRLGGWGLPLAGLGLVGLAGIGHVTRFQESYCGEITFYPASTTFVVASMGMVLLGLWTLCVGLDRRETASGGAVLAFFKRYSRFSLTTYVVHHAVHVWPLYLWAAREGRRDPWWYYQDAVSAPTALLLALLFIIGFYGVLVVWENKRPYSFEGMLRWLCET